METDENIETRRTVHGYTDDDLTRDEILSLFETVRWSPSSYNLQPWEFVVADDKEGQEALKECAYGQEHVTDAAAVVAVFGDLDRGAHAKEVFSDQADKGYTPEGRTEDLIERFEEEKPEGNEEWVVRSCMIAATTLMYAAWDRGIASCPMGGWDGDALRETLDVPETWYPVLMMTLGYPDEESDEWARERKWRRSAEGFVSFGKVSGGE